MIRSYNGDINLGTLNDLKYVCELHKTDRRNVIGKFEEEGEVSIYNNLDPFTGCPDELSDVITLRSMQEIEDFLSENLRERLEAYFRVRRPPKDQLLQALIDFIKEHKEFPNEEEMKQLEIAAEAKRVAESEAIEETLSPEQMILRDIIKLAESIMETRRENCPSDIAVHMEPYDDELWVALDGFSARIRYVRYFGYENIMDYKLLAMTKQCTDPIQIRYMSDGTVVAECIDWVGDKYIEAAFMLAIIDIHKNLVEIARREGIEFENDIDYDKIPM